LSSIKIDAIEDPILEVLARQGERALAIAPEAGNERLRRFVNKKVSDAMLDEKVRIVFARGFTRSEALPAGRPALRDEADVDDIVRTVARLHEIAVARVGRFGRVARSSLPSTPSSPSRTRPTRTSARRTRRLKESWSLQREFERWANVRFAGCR
jgi:hypothetical protein